MRPVEIDVDRIRQVRIRWEEGHESVYPLPLLRRNCPCATCRTEREEQQRTALPILRTGVRPADATAVESAELVGNYAIRFVWKDGHDTGIYDYALLRAMCPCEQCRGSGTGS